MPIDFIIKSKKETLTKDCSLHQTVLLCPKNPLENFPDIELMVAGEPWKVNAFLKDYLGVTEVGEVCSGTFLTILRHKKLSEPIPQVQFPEEDLPDLDSDNQPIPP